MNQHQIKLVRKTWRSLMGLNPAILGDLFYTKLFVEYPALRKLFPEDMNLQHIKLIEMLTSIVSSLENPVVISDEMKQMALRHRGYGVESKDYEKVGKCLIWTLEEGLKSEWNSELQEAWIECYKNISTTMIQAAHP
ncbi:MAG: globin domain-containing protein [Saprospiraceae bacterium]